MKIIKPDLHRPNPEDIGKLQKTKPELLPAPTKPTFVAEAAQLVVTWETAAPKLIPGPVDFRPDPAE